MRGWCCCTTRGSAQAYPDATVANAFGDRYVYNLCPSAPDARDYAVALCKDVTESYAGHRHLAGDAGLPALRPRLPPRIRADDAEPLARQSARPLLLRSLPGRRAGAPASTPDGLQRAGRARTSNSYLASDFDFPADMAEAFWLADTRSDGDLGAFLDWRCDVVTSLVAEIRARCGKDASVAVIPSVARPTGRRVV